MLLALGAAVAYATYILVADTVVPGADPFVAHRRSSSPAPPRRSRRSRSSPATWTSSFGSGGYAALAGLVLISTILAIITFFLGLELVGPSTASIVSAVEPAFTVTLAAIVFGETLGPIQLLGGVLVLSAVVVLQRRVG